MFHFGRFPSCNYGFIAWSVILHHGGSPIRISADRRLFAAPRGFSQLVASFFGSWCQGIPLVLFIAWTSWKLPRVSRRCSVLSCLSFANNCLKLFTLIYFSPFCAYCSLFYQRFLGKTLLFNRFVFLQPVSFSLFSIICSFLFFFAYSVFNDHLLYLI